MARASLTRRLRVLARRKLTGKAAVRSAQRLLRPVRCPHCRQYTRQRKASKLGAIVRLRRCEACGLTFTKGQSRQALKYDRVFQHLRFRCS